MMLVLVSVGDDEVPLPPAPGENATVLMANPDRSKPWRKNAIIIDIFFLVGNASAYNCDSYM